jgi:predicted lipoprotein with Yx(FWY)xxD motif
MKRFLLTIPVVVLVLAIAAVAATAHSGAGTATSAGYATTSSAATISTASHGLGTMLVDAKGRTLYLWKADTGHKSTCSGACAAAWPPVTTHGKPKARGAAKPSQLGTTKRSDGTTQVTYAGHPLYWFKGDTKAGQHNGQGSDAFGADWLVVAPSGKAITRGDS